MTEHAASSSPPTARDWTLPTLLGIVIAYAILNSVMLATAPDEYPLIGVAMLGAAVVQPILFGAWTALPCGSVLQRLLIVAPCVMVPLIVPLYVLLIRSPADLIRRDTIAISSATFSLFVVSIFVFLIFRACRFRLQRFGLPSDAAFRGFHFGIKHLLALMTIYGVVLGLAGGLTFRPEEPGPGAFFGPNFIFAIAFFGGAYISGVVLPTVAVPLCILYGRPSRNVTAAAAGFWLVVTMVQFLLFYDQGGGESLTIVLGAQLGALIIGTLTAFTLRHAGLRLMRMPRSSPSQPLVESGQN